MSLLYKKYQNKIKSSKTYGKWYGRAVILDTISTRQLAEEVSHATTVTYADVVAVLAELTTAIKSHLQNSQAVVLDGIGRFKVAVSTTGADSRTDFKASNIRRYRINYFPEIKFQPTGKVNENGKRLGTYYSPLLSGITAREFGSTTPNGGPTSDGGSTSDGASTSDGGSTSDGTNAGK